MILLCDIGYWFMNYFTGLGWTVRCYCHRLVDFDQVFFVMGRVDSGLCGVCVCDGWLALLLEAALNRRWASTRTTAMEPRLARVWTCSTLADDPSRPRKHLERASADDFQNFKIRKVSGLKRLGPGRRAWGTKTAQEKEDWNCWGGQEIPQESQTQGWQGEREDVAQTESAKGAGQQEGQENQGEESWDWKWQWWGGVRVDGLLARTTRALMVWSQAYMIWFRYTFAGSFSPCNFGPSSLWPFFVDSWMVRIGLEAGVPWKSVQTQLAFGCAPLRHHFTKTT